MEPMEASMVRSEACNKDTLSDMVEKLSTITISVSWNGQIAPARTARTLNARTGRSVTDRLQAAAAGDACLARTQIRARARTIDNRCQSRDASS